MTEKNIPVTDNELHNIAGGKNKSFEEYLAYLGLDPKKLNSDQFMYHANLYGSEIAKYDEFVLRTTIERMKKRNG